MMSLLTMFTMLLIFWGGFYFEAHTVGALVLVGVGMLGAGLLFAAAETHGFEGEYVCCKGRKPYRWESLYMDVIRLGLSANQQMGTMEKQLIYVQTPTGTQPVTGIFHARLNHEMSLILDTTEAHGEENIGVHAVHQG